MWVRGGVVVLGGMGSGIETFVRGWGGGGLILPRKFKVAVGIGLNGRKTFMAC